MLGGAARGAVEQVAPGQDDLALQLLWLLQALAAEAPTERWAETVHEAQKSAMRPVMRPV